MAKLRSMTMTEDGENLASAVLEFSLAELVMLARVFGNRNGVQNEETLAVYGESAGSAIYGAAADPLNMIYEDGVDDAARAVLGP